MSQFTYGTSVSAILYQPPPPPLAHAYTEHKSHDVCFSARQVASTSAMGDMQLLPEDASGLGTWQNQLGGSSTSTSSGGLGTFSDPQVMVLCVVIAAHLH
jgi:hypothetical protein